MLARYGLAAVLVALSPANSFAADVLQKADVRVILSSPVTCDVTEALTISLDRPVDIEHRVQSFDAAAVDLLGISGAEQTEPPRTIGPTRLLLLRFDQSGAHTYEIRYRVTQAADWAFRCPTWLPAISTDGRSRSVNVSIELPDGASPAGGAFPALQWRGRTGSATLGHLPSFVRAPYTLAGEPSPRTWDLSRLVDLTALGVLAGGTGLWAWRRRR